MKIKVNTENLLSALIILGYDKIDSFTFTAIMANMNLFDSEYEIEFVKDSELSKPFLYCVDSNIPFMYSIKENCNLSTNVSSAMKLNGIEYTFKEYISSPNNVLLAEFIDKYIDLKMIIIRKLITYGVDNINNFPHLFCDKEKNIIMEIFGINEMNKSSFKNNLKYNEMLCQQEKRDINNAIKSLDRFKK